MGFIIRDIVNEFWILVTVTRVNGFRDRLFGKSQLSPANGTLSFECRETSPESLVSVQNSSVWFESIVESCSSSETMSLIFLCAYHYRQSICFLNHVSSIVFVIDRVKF